MSGVTNGQTAAVSDDECTSFPTRLATQQELTVTLKAADARASNLRKH